MSTETPFTPPTFRDLSTWHLANLAGCGSPDRPDGIGVSPPADLSTVDPSPGAKFLRSVADDTAERIAYHFAGDDPRQYDPADLADMLAEELAEVADGAPSVYTHTRWEQFTDLAAWNEDTAEYGVPEDDLTASAGVALYVIAERLALALVESWAGELAAEVDA